MDKPITLDELIIKINAMIDNDDPQKEFERGWNSAINDITGGIIPDNREALEAGMKGTLKLTKDPGTRDRWLSDFDFMPNLTSNQWILFLNVLGITADFVEN